MNFIFLSPDVKVIGALKAYIMYLMKMKELSSLSFSCYTLITNSRTPFFLFPFLKEHRCRLHYILFFSLVNYFKFGISHQRTTLKLIQIPLVNILGTDFVVRGGGVGGPIIKYKYL